MTNYTTTHRTAQNIELLLLEYIHYMYMYQATSATTHVTESLHSSEQNLTLHLTFIYTYYSDDEH